MLTATETSTPDPSRLRTRDPLVNARWPLVKEHNVPLPWIQFLNVEELGLLLEAIQLADAHFGSDHWKGAWLEQDITARHVIDEVLPELRGYKTAPHASL